MLSNCDQCQFCTRLRRHPSDIGCAVQPSYWEIWFRLQDLEKSTLDFVSIENCRDFTERQELQQKELNITLTLEQWKTLTVTNRVLPELIEIVRTQLNIDTDEIVMHPVSSSNIEEIGYNRISQILQVNFLAGARYHYFDVPQNVFDEFLEANSKGQFFNQTIKHVYSYERIASTFI